MIFAYPLGGNLCVSLSLRAAEYGIRVPDSILAAYSPFNVQWVPSPSRLLSLMDPLLPTGLLGACLAAYSGMGKSPFDDCTKNSIKSLTGKSSEPVNISDKRKKANSLLRLLRVGSRDSKHRENSFLEGSPQASSESFHSCLSSPQSITGNSEIMSDPNEISGCHSSPKHLPQCNGILHCQENFKSEMHKHNEDQEPGGHSSSDHEKGDESGCTSLEHSQHPQSRKHSHDSTPSQTLSPQRSKHGRGDDSEHIAVHYHSDIEECHVVNVVESPGSPSKELLLFSLDVPEDEPYLEVGTPPEGDQGVEHTEDTHERTTSMSQVSLPIAKNPYMSPLLASDEMLRSLPPIDLVVRFFDFTMPWWWSLSLSSHLPNL